MTEGVSVCHLQFSDCQILPKETPKDQELSLPEVLAHITLSFSK